MSDTYRQRCFIPIVSNNISNKYIRKDQNATSSSSRKNIGKYYRGGTISRTNVLNTHAALYLRSETLFSNINYSFYNTLFCFAGSVYCWFITICCENSGTDGGNVIISISHASLQFRRHSQKSIGEFL